MLARLQLDTLFLLVLLGAAAAAYTRFNRSLLSVISREPQRFASETRADHGVCCALWSAGDLS